MAIQDKLTEIEQYLNNAWSALEAKGATIPTQKNTANLAAAIRSLPAPLSPFGELKEALSAGNAPALYPAGTEIPDTWGDKDNPLIVAQYLDSSNNSLYGGAEGVILVRKYADPAGMAFGTDHNYLTSTVRQYLNSEYYNSCSDALKSIINPISVSFTYGTSGQADKLVVAPDNYFFLMSTTEVYGKVLLADGVPWDYWKQQTGLSEPALTSNAGRVAYDQSGAKAAYWLRDTYNNTDGSIVDSNGRIYYATPTWSRDILPACFIRKD